MRLHVVVAGAVGSLLRSGSWRGCFLTNNSMTGERISIHRYLIEITVLNNIVAADLTQVNLFNVSMKIPDSSTVFVAHGINPCSMDGKDEFNSITTLSDVIIDCIHIGFRGDHGNRVETGVCNLDHV